MAFGDWFKWNQNSPEGYLEANYGTFGWSDHICGYGSNVCRGVSRRFSRRGSAIYAEITIDLSFNMSRSDWQYSSSVQHFLRDAFRSELAVCKEGLEAYKREYSEDSTRYYIDSVCFKDQNTGDTYEFSV
jgi:hypothetical protein